MHVGASLVARTMRSGQGGSWCGKQESEDNTRVWNGNVRSNERRLDSLRQPSVEFWKAQQVEE